MGQANLVFHLYRNLKIKLVIEIQIVLGSTEFDALDFRIQGMKVENCKGHGKTVSILSDGEPSNNAKQLNVLRTTRRIAVHKIYSKQIIYVRVRQYPIDATWTRYHEIECKEIVWCQTSVFIGFCTQVDKHGPRNRARYQ